MELLELYKKLNSEALYLFIKVFYCLPKFKFSIAIRIFFYNKFSQLWHVSI